jgi:hypothetical protein
LKSAVVDVQALRDDIGEQQRSLRHAQRVDRPTLCEQQRREVLRLWSEGHLAAEIQSLMPAPAPRLECIQWTIDNERRRTRGGLRPYEALHSICTEVLADSNQVLLYMVPDPDIDWDPRQSSASAPLGALHIAMFGTLAMINVLLVAHALGIDTKWRTRAHRTASAICLLPQYICGTPSRVIRAASASPFVPRAIGAGPPSSSL